MVAVFLFGASLAQAQPDAAWQIQDVAEDPAGLTGYPNSEQGAQSYAADRYENWQGSSVETCDADLEAFRVGADQDWLYAEWELRGSWNCGSQGTSRQLAVELDVDVEMEPGGDYVVIYNPEYTLSLHDALPIYRKSVV